MTTEIAYEIHAYSAGKWKIQGFFDNKDLAVAEARRMEAGRRSPGVRVIEERYDAQAGGYKSRTVYRSSAMDEENEAALKQRAEVRREVQQSRESREQEAARAQRTRKPAPSASRVYAMLAAKAIAIFAFGFGAIYALNQFAAG